MNRVIAVEQEGGEFKLRFERGRWVGSMNLPVSEPSAKRFSSLDSIRKEKWQIVQIIRRSEKEDK